MTKCPLLGTFLASTPVLVLMACFQKHIHDVVTKRKEVINNIVKHAFFRTASDGNGERPQPANNGGFTINWCQRNGSHGIGPVLVTPLWRKSYPEPRQAGWRTGQNAKVMLLGVVIVALAHGNAFAGPIVKIESGSIEGTRDKGVDRFLGVPFSAPPVGDLRWRAPQRVLRWRGVRKATGFGADCMQWPLDYVPGPGYLRPTSEDCLTLNIWRPVERGQKKLPVMVWIYGGAFMMGAGSWPVYHGANLARQGVIVITLNYRLGRFGFFAHPALTAENADGRLANYGLMDQIAALQWVQRNISSMGGDPEKVTIFGESAGAFSVNALLASPLTRGLFAQAISQSGGGEKGIGVLPDTDLSAAEAQGLRWTRSLGISDTDLAAMRALPAASVLGPKDHRVGGQIIIDGTIVPKPVDEAFLAGEMAHVPYMVGANSWEYSLLRWMPGVADTVLSAMGTQRAQLLNLYDKDGKAPQKDEIERIWADAFMVAPARHLARQMAITGAPTFLYRYSYVPVASRGQMPGAAHSAEISLVFHNEIDGPYFAENAADSDMASQISGYWVRFARTGNPNGDNAPFWPPYAPASDTLIDFTDEGPKIRINADKEKFDLIDQAYLQHIH